MIRLLKISVTMVVLLLSVFISGCNKGKGGCTDPHASNYDSDASYDDGTCIVKVFGCTDPASNNYNPDANTDDGSCDYTRDVTIWMGPVNGTCSSTVYVYLDDSYKGYLTVHYSSAPACGASGAITVNNVTPGTHKFYAQCANGYSYGPTYLNVTGTCFKWRVY
jgi:hypothetical protein